MDIWEKSAGRPKSQGKGPVVIPWFREAKVNSAERWQGWRVGVDRVIGDEFREVRTNIKASSSFL